MRTLDIGIAVNKNQDHEWWPAVFTELMNAQADGVFTMRKLITVGSAQADFNKCTVVDVAWKPLANTAENRNGVVGEHMDGEAEGIMWIDDDTAIPYSTMRTLLSHWDHADIIGGLYRKRSEPYDVIGYKRMPNGAYVPLSEFQPGEIVECDSVGMGCTLVKRSVYERIRLEYVVLRRKVTSSLIAVHQEDLQGGVWPVEFANRVVIAPDGRMAQMLELEPVLEAEINRWPFYAMEYQRTEDHHFCEMAKRVGARIIADTAIVCKHWGSSATSEVDYRKLLAERMEAECAS